MFTFEEYLASLAVLVALAVVLFGAGVLVLLIQSAAAWLAERVPGGTRPASRPWRARWPLFHHHPPAHS